MTDTLILEDWYGKDAPVEELEEVTLYDGPVIGNAADVPLSQSTEDFEYIEVYGYYETPSAVLDSEKVPKIALSDSATRFIQITARYTNSVSLVEVFVDKANSNSNALRVVTTVSTGYTNAGINRVVGFKKRFATKNLSRTVSVNGGNNIAVNSRYEVQLTPEFYEENGDIKKGVSIRAEVFNNSGTGEAKFGDTGWTYAFTAEDFSYGVKASIMEDKAIVQTGRTTLGATSSNSGSPFGNTDQIAAAPCRVIATLNDAYIVNIEGPQSEFERIINDGVNVLQFTASGQFAYIPLSNSDFDGEIFEYNSTTRFIRVKKTGIYSPFLFSHAEDGAGTAQIKYTLIEADTANGDNPVPKTGTFTKQYDADGGTLSIHLPLELDESKWYAVYAENYSGGNVTYTTVSNATSDPNLANTTDFAFTFTLEQH